MAVAASATTLYRREYSYLTISQLHNSSSASLLQQSKIDKVGIDEMEIDEMARYRGILYWV